jgi:PAN domain
MIPSSKMVLVCCVFYTLFPVAYGWPTFCPVTSPLYDAVYITDDPSKSLVGLTKTGCATQCAFCADIDVNCGATKCSCFNYNSTSMNCSLFYFQPTTTAVDSTSTTIAYQVRLKHRIRSCPTSKPAIQDDIGSIPDAIQNIPTVVYCVAEKKDFFDNNLTETILTFA